MTLTLNCPELSANKMTAVYTINVGQSIINIVYFNKACPYYLGLRKGVPLNLLQKRILDPQLSWDRL